MNSEDKNCSICLEIYDKSCITLTNCGHCYHDGCIYTWIRDKWNTRNNELFEIACPICRRQVTLIEINLSLKYFTTSRSRGILCYNTEVYIGAYGLWPNGMRNVGRRSRSRRNYGPIWQ